MADLGPSPFAIGGTAYCTIPAGVTFLQVECYGGGAGGGNGRPYVVDAWGQAGGGGGAYAKTLSIPVTPGATYLFTVGVGGSGGIGPLTSPTNGGNTYMVGNSAISCIAAGGKSAINYFGGVGGAIADCTGDVKYAGGNGYDGDPGASGGAGGGGCAGTSGNGGIGHDNVGGLGGAGGSSGGGYAGGGGHGGNLTTNAGLTAGLYYGGGGGGGGRSTGAISAAGYQGLIIVTYVVNPVITNPRGFNGGVFSTAGMGF
jgi:hypothetical protein